MKPYIDNEMTFNKKTRHYVLTQEYVQKLDPDIITGLKNPSDIITTLEEISDDIYDFIHEHNANNDAQDFIIAHTETGREIIKKAMEKQLLYMAALGDASLFLDDKRKFWISDKATRVLLRTIPEISTCILYTGSFPIRSYQWDI
jgi:hypothetical protein